MGRHREFDADEVLDAAVRVFWAKGYEGTSYDDLCAATGVKRPGLYRVFGNKEELFHRVLARYRTEKMGYVDEALKAASSRAMAERFLRGVIDVTTHDPQTPGCLGVNGALACSAASDPVRKLLVGYRAGGGDMLREALDRFIEAGDLPPSTESAALATYLMTIAHGVAVQAKSGFTRAELEAVARQAMAAWPSPSAEAAQR
jgi:AcrR family transcriptional regulator